jgi:hypothetical protein
MRKTRPLYQRYRREFWPPMAAYIAVMLLLWPLLPRVHNEWLKIALAQLPVVPLLFAVRAMVRLAMGGDELEQRIHLIALAIAATVVSMLSLVGGFLAAAHLINLDGTILMWMWPTLVAVYSAARVWASHRYGGAGDGVGTCDRHGPVRVGLVDLAGVCRGHPDHRVPTPPSAERVRTRPAVWHVGHQCRARILGVVARYCAPAQTPARRRRDIVMLRQLRASMGSHD